MAKKIQNGYESNPNKNNTKETPTKIYIFISRIISFIFNFFNYNNIKENKKLDEKNFLINNDKKMNKKEEEII